MNIKDLKVGDKVYIREDLKQGKRYGDHLYFNNMGKGIQQIQSINIRTGNFNIFARGNYFYSPEMIDWEKTEELIYKVKKIDDNIYNPLHYSGGGKHNIECYEAIEYILGKLENVPEKYYGHVSNIVKYIWRCNDKNGYEDLDKTSVYLDFMFRKED